MSEDLLKWSLKLIKDFLGDLELFLHIKCEILMMCPLTSSSMDLALYLVANVVSLFLNIYSSLSAKVGRSDRLEYLMAAALTSASKNCL